MDTALLVIDAQYGIFMRKHMDGVAVYNEDTFLRNIASLCEKARAKGIPVIYTQHVYHNFPPMAKDQPYWQIHPEIAPLANDIVIEKEHADAFWNTGLDSLLHDLGVTNLIITGIQTEYCVDTTCRRALSLGYRATLVSDGHSTLDTEFLPAEKIIAHHNSVLATQFVMLKTAAEALAL